MFVQRLILLMALCWLTVGCSTSGYYRNVFSETTTRTGVRYLLGRGVKRDNEKAFYYFKKAAEKDHDTFAQNEIAYMYLAGKGTKRDEKEAFKWYQRAANSGLASAEYNLGLMYLYGLGTKEDKTIGMAWIKKSADHGFLPAQNELASLTMPPQNEAGLNLYPHTELGSSLDLLAQLSSLTNETHPT